MATIFGNIQVSDSDRLLSVANQRVIYDAVTQWLADRNEELNRAIASFVEGTVTEAVLRYKFPGSGYLQRRSEQGDYAAIKTDSGWDVAFPIYDYGAALVGDDIALAYMTVGQFEQQVQTVWSQNVNTVRLEILRALLSKENATYTDPLSGSLTIRRLANGDGTLYPPKIGGTGEEEENHYITLGSATISDSYNPVEKIIADLQEHFGNGDIVIFHSPSETKALKALTGFVEVADPQVIYGASNRASTNVPDVPGVVIGRHLGAWLAEWAYIPAGYMFGLDLRVAKPLLQRIDPPDTGLGSGLQLVARDEQFPFRSFVWRNRFGFGVGNRLNGVALQITASGTYTSPTIG